MSPPTIAVTGSDRTSGRTGSQAPGRRRRSASASSFGTPPGHPTCPGAHTAIAAYGDHAASVAALEGVETLFMVSASETPTDAHEHPTSSTRRPRRACATTVYASFYGAAPDATFTLARDHAATEEHLLASGMACDVPARQPLRRLLPPLMTGDGRRDPRTRRRRVGAPWSRSDDIARGGRGASSGTRSAHDGRPVRPDRPGGAVARPGRRGADPRARAATVTYHDGDARGGVRVTASRTALRSGRSTPGSAPTPRSRPESSPA